MVPAVEGLSFQLYSARSLQPLEEQFELLAALGYTQVEPFSGLLDDPSLLHSLLKRYRMAMPTIHVGMDRLRQDARGAARLCRDLGAQIIFAPAPLPLERDQDADGWRALGRELATISRAVVHEGLAFGWHNHHWEFAPLADGRTFLDLLFEEAPDLLWEADLAWVVRAGADPVAELTRRRDRVAALHVKDLAPDGENEDEGGWADPGHGVMDWDRIRMAMADAGVKLLVVEHDKPSDVARFARRAQETVASWR